MKTLIGRIIAVEGLDKTGKSTFIDAFDATFQGLTNQNNQTLKKFAFPNKTTPIGKAIRDELDSENPNKNIVSSPFFLSEMSHYWMIELHNLHKKNSEDDIKTNNSLKGGDGEDISQNYIFDRYFFSTMAHQAFYNDSKFDLDFIQTSILENKFLKMPTDLIFIDAPNEVIINRTIEDQKNNLIDSGDTIDEDVINQRRDAYKKSLEFFSGIGIKYHIIEDASKYDPYDLSKILIGKIFP